MNRYVEATPLEVNSAREYLDSRPVTKGKVNVTFPKDINYETLELSTAIDMISKKKSKKKYFKR